MDIIPYSQPRRFIGLSQETGVFVLLDLEVAALQRNRAEQPIPYELGHDR
jgi:hypothetical protein